MLMNMPPGARIGSMGGRGIINGSIYGEYYFPWPRGRDLWPPFLLCFHTIIIFQTLMPLYKPTSSIGEIW